MFKGGHLILAEHRGFCPAPQLPHHVHGQFLSRCSLRHEIGILPLLVKDVYKRQVLYMAGAAGHAGRVDVQGTQKIISG